MSKIGIIGGIGPESTIQYYRMLIQKYRERYETDHYPEFFLHSIDMKEMLDLIGANKLEEVIDFLRARVLGLEATGVSCVALASNTPHLVFEELASTVNIELVSIVEATCHHIRSRNLQKVGLLGTKFTMSKGFYQRVGKQHQLDIVIPEEADQDYIHEKYMGELVFNNINPRTKERLMEIVREMQRIHHIEGIILGGTELPLILGDDDFQDLKVFNTTLIHVEAILDRFGKIDLG